MRLLAFLLICNGLFACAYIPGSDVVAARTMENYLARGNLWAAHNYYQGLDESRKQSPAVTEKFKKFNTELAKIRKMTVNKADLAVRKSDWKQAIDLYQDQIHLIEIDASFDNSYQNFLKRLAREKTALSDGFIVTRAQYLIKAIPIMKSEGKLYPYDLEKQQALAMVLEEAKDISSRLLELGVAAMRKKDIVTASSLLPLAKQLHNNKDTQKANRTLEKLSESFDKHITRLTDEGMQLYSLERYRDALDKWNEILYLDPENEKIQDHKTRTEKVLQSLEELKKQQSLKDEQ